MKVLVPKGGLHRPRIVSYRLDRLILFFNNLRALVVRVVSPRIASFWLARDHFVISGWLLTIARKRGFTEEKAGFTTSV